MEYKSRLHDRKNWSNIGLQKQHNGCISWTVHLQPEFIDLVSPGDQFQARLQVSAPENLSSATTYFQIFSNILKAYRPPLHIFKYSQISWKLIVHQDIFSNILKAHILRSRPLGEEAPFKGEATLLLPQHLQQLLKSFQRKLIVGKSYCWPPT